MEQLESKSDFYLTHLALHSHGEGGFYSRTHLSTQQLTT